MILAATLLAIVALCGITWRLTRPPAPAALIEQQYLDAQRQHARELQLAEEYEMQAAVHRVRAASYERREQRLKGIWEFHRSPKAANSGPSSPYPWKPRKMEPSEADALAARLEADAKAQLKLDEYRQRVEKTTSQLLADGKVPPDLRAQWAEGSLDHFALGRALERRGLIPPEQSPNVPIDPTRPKGPSFWDRPLTPPSSSATMPAP